MRCSPANAFLALFPQIFFIFLNESSFGGTRRLENVVWGKIIFENLFLAWTLNIHAGLKQFSRAHINILAIAPI